MKIPRHGCRWAHKHRLETEKRYWLSTNLQIYSFASRRSARRLFLTRVFARRRFLIILWTQCPLLPFLMRPFDPFLFVVTGGKNASKYVHWSPEINVNFIIWKYLDIPQSVVWRKRRNSSISFGKNRKILQSVTGKNRLIRPSTAWKKKKKNPRNFCQ